MRGWAAEVVLADMQSEDETVERARGAYDRLMSIPLIAEFDAARNQTAATVREPWILFLDADERLTETVRLTISDLVRADDPGVAAYQLPFKVLSFGRWICHSGNWWPSYKSPPLLRTGRFRFSGRVHEPAIVDGRVLRIAPKDEDDAILHLSHRDLSHYFEKLNRYTSLEALRRPDEGSWERAAQGMGEVFRWHFDTTQGSRDGSAGLFLAFGSAVYEALIQLKLMESTGCGSVPPSAGSFLAMAARAAKGEALTGVPGSAGSLFSPSESADIACPFIGARVPGMRVVEAPGRARIRTTDVVKGLDWDDPRGGPSLTVAVTTHRNALEVMGGGEIQLLETVRALEDSGVQAEIGIGLIPVQGELIHLFSLHHEENCSAIRSSGRPYVITPIYWDRGELSWVAPRILRMAERCETLGSLEAGFSSLGRQVESLRAQGAFVTPLPGFLRELVSGAAMVLPNAQCEADCLSASLGGELPETRIIPNAAPAPESELDSAVFDFELPGEPFVLCVGRVEINKNQLALCAACRILGVPLVLAGELRDPAYEALCRRTASSGALLCGPVTRVQAASLMRKAAVHALPSFAETPGLANLEADALGCRLVCSNRGAESEYFKEGAEYCDPLSIDSIADAIGSAMKRKRRRDKNQRTPDWNAVGRLTAGAYRSILGRGPQASKKHQHTKEDAS